LLNSM